MQAAAHGHSTLGIPKSVGEEFVQADRHDAAPAAEADPAAPLAAHDGTLSDYEIAEALRDGRLVSPQKFGDAWLFDLRVTGTGAAYRDAIDEFVVRDPAVWLSPEFVERASHLPVIFEHPAGRGLNTEEYRERAIGHMMLAYVKDDEVRGVAKIFDADAAALMQTTHTSTSPGVIHPSPEGSEVITLESGARVLAEGLPLILDHLAVCKVGVWDKGGPPDGIRLDSQKGQPVADKDDLKERFDSMSPEERKDARAWLDAADAKNDSKKDESEESEERKDARKDESEERETKDKDAEKKAEELAEHEREEMRADKKDAKKDAAEMIDSKKDGAKVEDVDVEEGTALKDSAARALIADQEKTIKRLEAQVADMRRPVSPADGAALSKAFHRADSIFQMLGEPTPRHYPGETPTAYRRRLAHDLRAHAGDRWKGYTFNDALDETAFGAIEDLIYDAAAANAKKPGSGGRGSGLREVVTQRHGKTTVRFYGDESEAWTPFMPPMRRLVRKINRTPGLAAR